MIGFGGFARGILSDFFEGVVSKRVCEQAKTVRLTANDTFSHKMKGRIVPKEVQKRPVDRGGEWRQVILS